MSGEYSFCPPGGVVKQRRESPLLVLVSKLLWQQNRDNSRRKQYKEREGSDALVIVGGHKQVVNGIVA